MFWGGGDGGWRGIREEKRRNGGRGEGDGMGWVEREGGFFFFLRGGGKGEEKSGFGK